MLIDLKSLIERLQESQCVEERDTAGVRFTKWMYLRRIDVDYAIEYLKEELKNQERKSL